MKNVSCFLREVVANLAPGHFNPSVTYETKSNYGGPELIYITSDHKDAFQQLTGSKTLAPRHVEALQNLGFVFHHIAKKHVMAAYKDEDFTQENLQREEAKWKPKREQLVQKARTLVVQAKEQVDLSFEHHMKHGRRLWHHYFHDEEHHNPCDGVRNTLEELESVFEDIDDGDDHIKTIRDEIESRESDK